MGADPTKEASSEREHTDQTPGGAVPENQRRRHVTKARFTNFSGGCDEAAIH